MGQADVDQRRTDPVLATSQARGFGLRFVIAITLFVVGFAALVAFVMYWLAPIQ